MSGEQRPQLVALDLMRAAAAFAVMIGHVRASVWIDYTSLTTHGPGVYAFFLLTRLGHEAVMVFFVLSGFLVGGKVIKGLKCKTFGAADYALDRATRILLPLIPACLFTLAVNAVVFGDAPDIATALGNMVGLNGVLVPTLSRNAPLWSLAFEI